mgnify:CR=1 FL=1
MKTKTPILATLGLFLGSSLVAESVSNLEDIDLLRQEIRKHEIVLQALKEKLQRIEEKNENFFEISISETGVQAKGKPISPHELEATLEALPDGAKITIRAESTVKYKKVASVMQLCAKAGLTDVVFATTQAEPDASGQRR